MRGRKTGGGSRKGIPNKSTQEIKELLDQKVDFGLVISKLFELSQGVEVEKYGSKESVVYCEKPDAFAAKILLEYRYGKPLQRIDQTSSGIGTIQKFKIGDQEIFFE